MSKPGVTQSLVMGGLGIRAGLRRALFEPEKHVRQEPRVFCGLKPLGNRRKTYSDETILQVRRLREWDGRSLPSIASEMNLSRHTVATICSYINRRELEPGPKPIDPAA